MPHGFIITEWTEDQGLIVKLSYPENLETDLDDMMRIFYAHITSAGKCNYYQREKYFYSIILLSALSTYMKI